MGYSVVIRGACNEEPDLLQVGCRGGSGAAARAIVPPRTCSAPRSIRCGAGAGGHISVEVASTHDTGCFMLLCWLYSAPGEADHDGSSFSLGLSCSLAFLCRVSEGGQEKTGQGGVKEMVGSSNWK